MNSRQIETFVAVMKAGPISRATELLGVTQPGVSRTIADLETSVGFLLFDRVRNRIVPTPEGSCSMTRSPPPLRHGQDPLCRRPHT